MMVSKWTFLFQGLIFRFHVKFRGCTFILERKTSDSIYHLLAERAPSGRQKNGQSTVELGSLSHDQQVVLSSHPQVVYDVNSINSTEWGPLSVVK